MKFWESVAKVMESRYKNPCGLKLAENKMLLKK